VEDSLRVMVDGLREDLDVHRVNGLRIRIRKKEDFLHGRGPTVRKPFLNSYF